MESVSDFHLWLNSRNQFLRFTFEAHKERLSFSDLSIFVTLTGLHSELYRKPMVRNLLLLYESHHPKSLRDNLPYRQFLRIRRHCSRVENYKSHAKNLSSQLAERSYPRSLIKRSCKQALNNNRETLLEPPVPKSPTDRLTLVSTFNTRSNSLQKIIRKHWRILNHSNDKIALPLFAFKRANRIRDRLVHTRPKETPKWVLGTLWDLPPAVGHQPCGNCPVCPQTKHSTEIDIGTDRPWS